MKYYSDDDLDRLLLSLPLEEPPANLRMSILAATIYRPAPVKAWEAWLMGSTVAMIAWLLILILRSGTAPVMATINAIAGAAVTVFSAPATLLWIALGGAAAMWLLQLNPAVAPAGRGTVRN